MKRFTLMSMVACMCMAASAQKAVLPVRSLAASGAERQSVVSVADAPMSLINGVAANGTNMLKVAELPAKGAGRVALADENSGLITAEPEGRVVEYVKTGKYHYRHPNANYVIGGNASGGIGHVVYADDGSVYIKNPFAGIITDSYLKGTRNGDELTITLPQPIFEERDESDVYIYEAARFIWDDVNWVYAVDPNETEIKFTLRNDSLIWNEANDGSVRLGLSYGGQYMGFSDYDVVYAPFTEEPLELPANLNTEDWAFITYNYGHLVKMAFDGNDVYLGNLYKNMPDAWVKGTVDGNKVRFAGTQYLGPNEDTNSYLYMVAAKVSEAINPDYGTWYYQYNILDSLEFNYDADAKTMSVATDSTVVLINRGCETSAYIEMYELPSLKYQPDVVGAVKPATPIMDYYFPYSSEYGYGYIDFNLPNYDVDGNYLDESKLHYNMFVDDELFTFYPDEYVALDDELVNIPYNFTDNYDIRYDGILHCIFFYMRSFDKLGIRSTYTADNGESMDSDIAWYYVNGTGIDAVEADEANVESIVYTDIAGRRVSAPVKGLFIKTVKYNDGTVKSSKILKK